MFTASDASSQKVALSAGCGIQPEHAYHVTEDSATLQTAVRHKVLSGTNQTAGLPDAGLCTIAHQLLGYKPDAQLGCC